MWSVETEINEKKKELLFKSVFHFKVVYFKALLQFHKQQFNLAKKKKKFAD